MPGILDHDLLDAIDNIDAVPFEGNVWRVAWANREPTAGSPGGGRWAPPNQFEVLYTSLDQDGAVAEVYNLLSRAPVMSSSNKTINCIELSLARVLRLDGEQLAQLGISDALANRPDNSRTRAVGEAAYMLDFAGLIIPSARWDCENLVLFLDRIDINTQIRVMETNDLNWPAWVERHKGDLR